MAAPLLAATLTRLAELGARFIATAKGQKHGPDGWPNIALSAKQTIRAQRNGRNILINLGQSRDILVCDIDGAWSRVQHMLPSTLTIGRVDNPEHRKCIYRYAGKHRGKYGASITSGTGEKIGTEIFITSGATVIAGVHPEGSPYLAENEGTIAEITDDQLAAIWYFRTGGDIEQEYRAAKIRQEKRTRPAAEASHTPDPLTARLSEIPVLDIFVKYGKTDRTTKKGRELKLHGNGGLYVDEKENRWYCHGEQVGGGPLQAFGWCTINDWKLRQDTMSGQEWRRLKVELARTFGIDWLAYVRQNSGAPPPASPEVVEALQLSHCYLERVMDRPRNSSAEPVFRAILKIMTDRRAVAGVAITKRYLADMAGVADQTALTWLHRFVDEYQVLTREPAERGFVFSLNMDKIQEYLTELDQDHSDMIVGLTRLNIMSDVAYMHLNTPLLVRASRLAVDPLTGERIDAVAGPSGRLILATLDRSDAGMCVSEIAEATRLRVPTVSRVLAHLRRLSLVVFEKAGRRHCYYLHPDWEFALKAASQECSGRTILHKRLCQHLNDRTDWHYSKMLVIGAKQGRMVRWSETGKPVDAVMYAQLEADFLYHEAALERAERWLADVTRAYDQHPPATPLPVRTRTRPAFPRERRKVDRREEAALERLQEGCIRLEFLSVGLPFVSPAPIAG